MGKEISYGFNPKARLKFLVVHVCGKSFLNEDIEYGRLGCAVLANFLEPSLWFLLMYA